MKFYAGEPGSVLRELKALEGQHDCLYHLTDNTSLRPRVAIKCERCGNRVCDVYDVQNSWALDRDDLYPIGPVAVLRTKEEPGQVIVFIEVDGAPATLPCSCRRDGFDLIATRDVLDAVRRERGYSGKRQDKVTSLVEVLYVNRRDKAHNAPRTTL